MSAMQPNVVLKKLTRLCSCQTKVDQRKETEVLHGKDRKGLRSLGTSVTQW